LTWQPAKTTPPSATHAACQDGHLGLLFEPIAGVMLSGAQAAWC
jgi:hypothetical protein